MKRGHVAAFVMGTFGCCAVSLVAKSSTITFESVPSGIPTDGLVISNQFLATDGISFRFTDGTFPRLAQVGAPRTAFAGPPNDSAPDTPAEGQLVGQFFLTDDGVVGSPPPPLIVTYAAPVASASGVLLDIDGDESWQITARDATTNELASLTISDGDAGTGDGIATVWLFDTGSTNIHSIRFAVTDPSGSTGLAFDNFSPSSSTTLFDIKIVGIRTVLGSGSGTDAELWWDSVSGLFYQVQSVTDLAVTNWSDVGAPVQAEGVTTYWLDAVGTTSQKYYRVASGD